MGKSRSKNELRQNVLQVRDGLSVEERIEKSLMAAELGAEKIDFEPGTIISGFFPIRSEIDPRPLMDQLRVRGATLALPVVIDKTTIEFRELVREAELVDTGFGTRGPGPDARVVDPQILLMPLSVFDDSGGRIGYGAGHYDRAIARITAKHGRPRLIGFAFDCQRQANVPQESHDERLDAIITDSGYQICA